MACSKNQELMIKVLSLDLSMMKKTRYLELLSAFCSLFITSHGEIRGFEGEELRIYLKDGASPIKKNMRCTKKRMQALKKKDNKLLKVGLINDDFFFFGGIGS